MIPPAVARRILARKRVLAYCKIQLDVAELRGFRKWFVKIAAKGAEKHRRGDETADLRRNPVGPLLSVFQ